MTFPRSAAGDAKTVCDRIVSMLGEDLLARADLVTEAREGTSGGWTGPHRDEFDTTWDTYSDDLLTLKDDLATLAGDIQDALDEATTINSRRAEDREAHDREQAAREEAAANG